MDGADKRAHLGGPHWRKQTTTVIQGRRSRRSHIGHLSMGGKIVAAPRHDGRRCNGDWTPGANRYWVSVKKQTKTTRKGPSAPGRLSSDVRYAACFFGAAWRALARWIRFSLAARPRRTCGFIAGTTRAGAFTCSCPRHWDPFVARLPFVVRCGPIQLAIVKMG